MDRHRHRRDGRPERAHLPRRLSRRLRPKPRYAAERAGPGTIPALERNPGRPAHLGAATPARLTQPPVARHEPSRPGNGLTRAATVTTAVTGPCWHGA